MRVRLITLVLATAAAAMLFGSVASAQVVPPGVGIGDDLFVTGATVTPPEGAGEEPRTMDDYDAAVYVQSWLACAFFCGPEAVKDPPPDLPVYRVDATGTWNGEPGTVTSYYVVDGDTPYIAFPGLVVWNDPTQMPEPSQWFIPPQRVVDAFNGEAELIESTGTQNPASGMNNDPPEDEEAVAESDDDSAAPLIIGGAVVLAALIGGGLWLRRRRAADPAADDALGDEPTTDEPVADDALAE